MRRFSDLSVGVKFIAVTFAGIAVLSAIYTFSNAVSLRRHMGAEFEGRVALFGSSLAGNLRDQLAVIMAFDDKMIMQTMVDPVRQTLEGSIKEEDIVYAAILHPDGSVITQAVRDAGDKFALPSKKQPFKTISGQCAINSVEDANAAAPFELSIPIEKDGKVLGTLLIGYTDARIRSAIRGAVAASIAIGLLGALTVCGLVVLFTRLLVTGPLDRVILSARRIAAGDLNFSTGAVAARKDEIGELSTAFENVAGTLRSLTEEMAALSQAAVEGRLSVRGDAGKFQGGYRDVVKGVNDTLDAVITPLQMAAKNLERISHGDIPPRIEENYQGDFNDIKKSLNLCIDAINALIVDEKMLADATIAGDLDRRADLSRHEGDYRRIVEGINGMMERFVKAIRHVVKLLDALSAGKTNQQVDGAYQGEYNNLKTGFNGCFSAISAMVRDVEMLSQAAVAGRLSTRAGAASHRGDYRAIVEGINATLDAVLLPVNDAAAVLAKMAKNDYSTYITKDYKGDHALIKNSINNVLDALRPVDDAINVLAQMAQNDFTRYMNGDYKGEHALRIKNNVNRVLDTLNNSLGRVVQATSSIADAAQQLSSTAEQMAAGAQEQTTQAAQVATSMEEMSATVQEVAKNSGVAAEKARAAGESAVNGGDVVSQTVDEINKISESVSNLQGVIQELAKNSEKIGDIIGVIDDVADQTNLLALNAAIEAARAGEQGRGFAVVADEVRKLAERTTTSTKEISGMIKSIQTVTKRASTAMEHSSQQVESGIVFATSAGSSLKEIVDTTRVVQELVNHIASATEQQSTAAEEISSNIEAIASVSKQTASGAGNTSNAAGELSRLTGELQQLTSLFRLR